MKKEKLLIALAVGAGAAAVTYSLLSSEMPEGAKAVQPFDLMRYLGKWNEVARLPNWVEKNLTHVTEHYSLDENSDIKVVTKAYHTGKNKWKEATGKIKFTGPDYIGQLKVS